MCEDTAFSGGKYADEFDKEFAQYCGVPYASGVNNGTSALHCAMVALGIGEGDEVIVPANTYIATAWGVTYTGQLRYLWTVLQTHGKSTRIKSKKRSQRRRKQLLVYIYMDNRLNLTR